MSDASELDEVLQSLDPTTRTFVAEADMGRQAREFAESDVGRYIIGCAQQEIADAQEKLERTMPWRRRRIQELQNQAWRARTLLAWIRGLIESGKAAEDALHEGEGED